MIGGGVAIYVRNGTTFKERQDLNIHVNDLEAFWVEITVNHRKLLVGGIYRPPNSNNNYWRLLEQNIDQDFSKNSDSLIITGD